MNLQYRFEPLNYLLQTGLVDLGERSWSEIGNDKQTFQYNPDWHEYERMQQQDMLRFLAVRDDTGLLVGYASVIVRHNLHDKNVLCAIIQDIYLEPEHRKGMGAFKRFEQTLEGLLKGIGVKHIAVAERENDPRGGVGEVYRRLGFNSCERIWTKSI